ncbi:DUF2806 domain-containing protein [Collinsella tanakaei]|uniref:DUF2806 domain-containing protein n=1 Tax=Collinsella tanakaei TaxID=626935 RepID=UPI00338ECD37
MTESLIEDVKTRHRRIANIASVVSFAEPEVNRDTDGSAEIDFDWIELFKSYAERTSSKDVQVIWGKLLAGELNHPGSYSKLAMWSLFNMSEKNAHDFAALASMCVHHCDKNGVAYGEPLLILDSDSQPDSDAFNGGAISIRDVNMLASLGLVDTSSMRTLSFDPGQRQLFRGAEFMVEVTNGSDMQIDLVLLPIITCAGLELLELSSIGTFQSLLE